MKQAIISIAIIACMLVATIPPLNFTEHAQAEDLPTFEPQSTTWLDGWEYRKEITISNNIEGYQTKITVSQSDDATDDVDCEGHCNNNFSDLRFACANGTLVPYWIEEETDGDECTVWINNSYNDTMLYMYYGNSDAGSVSNGDDTFELFESFSGNSLDTNKWETIGVSETFSNGIITLSPPFSNDLASGLYSIDKHPTEGYALESRVQFEESNNNALLGLGSINDGSTRVTDGDCYGTYHWQNGHIMWVRVDGSETDRISVTKDQAFHTYRFYNNGTDVRFWMDGIDKGTISSHADLNVDLYVQVVGYDSSEYDGDINIDYIRNRKYSDTEPSFTFGDEEQPEVTWYSGWDYSKKITLNSSQIPGDLSNFPVCINITDIDLRDKAQTDGDDIAFISADNTTQYSHEIEVYDNSNGQLVAWVNVTSLAHDADTIIYMYYGNDSASNQEDVADTWSSDYSLVHHFEETDIDGGSGDIKDSTSNNNDGTTSGMDGNDQISGMIDGSFDFDGTDDIVNLDSSFSTYSLNIVFNVPNSITGDFGGNGAGTIVSGNSGKNVLWLGGITSAFSGETLLLRCNDGDYDYKYIKDTVPEGWNILTVIFDTSESEYEFYLNNDKKTTYQYRTLNYYNTAFDDIGGRSGLSYNEIQIDEMQASSSSEFSEDQISTFYNMITNATDGGFFTLDDEQTPGNQFTAWGYNRSITFNSSQIPSNLTNFPVCINITDSHLKDNAQADGDDILFTADNVTKLNHEIELYNSSTGQLVAWVNITDLSSSSDTTIYMYYGNATCNNQESVADTWDDKFTCILHLSGASIIDSSDNDYSISEIGTYETDAYIGKGREFEGTNDYLDLPNGFYNFAATEDLTFSIYFKYDSGTTAGGRGLFDCREDKGIWCFIQDTDDGSDPSKIAWTYRVSGSLKRIHSDDAMETGIWYYTSMQYDGGLKMYIDGTVQTETLSCGFPDSGSSADYNTIGTNAKTIYDFDGVMDEIRVSSVARSANWEKTTYNSINNATDGGFFELEPIGPTNSAPNTPTSPQCQNITNPDHLTDHTPYFDWVFSDSDTNDTQHGFQIQVGNDTDWGTIEMWNYQENTSNNFTTYNGSSLHDGDTYYWRVRVKDNDSAWSDYTSNQQFRMNSVPVPILNTPVNESTEMPYTTKSINLTWTCDADAETDSLNWEWQYARSSDFTVDEVHHWSTGHTYRTIPMTGELYEEEDYYWRVRAWDGIEYGDYSEWRTFRTDAYINLTEPTTEDGATDVSVNLNEWSINITHDEGTFNWWINTTPDIGNASGFTETDGIKTCQLSGLEYNTTYEVQVVVIGSSRNETYTFTTEEDPGDHIQVTVSPQAEANITVNRSEWTPAIGITEHTSTTTDWANLENTGSIQVDVTVNISNTANWTAATTPGHNQFRIIIYNGTTWYDLGNSPITFKENLAYNEDQTFGLQLYMPTSSETNTNQTAKITFVATAD